MAVAVRNNNANLGIAVDPDVDRLVFMDEKGVLFGEEYTLVACADYVLKHQKGAVVSNLSSSRALADLAQNMLLIIMQVLLEKYMWSKK